MKDLKGYPLYKGLQKPLVFKGFKGRYIYWGMASIGINLIIGCSICLLIDKTIGLIAMALLMFSAFGFILKKQEKGLFPRKRDKKGTIYIFKNKL